MLLKGCFMRPIVYDLPRQQKTALIRTSKTKKYIIICFKKVYVFINISSFRLLVR